MTLLPLMPNIDTDSAVILEDKKFLKKDGNTNSIMVRIVIKYVRATMRTNLSKFLDLLIFYFALWQYGLWCFRGRDTKLERFLHKNQHTQRKLLNFENWTNGAPQ